MKLYYLLILSTVIFITTYSNAQKINWANDGKSYFTIEKNEIVQYQLPSKQRKVMVQKNQLIPVGFTNPITIYNFYFHNNYKKVLLYTNTKKVWRQNTKGDYWVLDFTTNKLNKIGKTKPISSLMFAKLSPNGNDVAYVCENNLYVENVKTGISKPLTKDGNQQIINGNFDWAYEEEFFCRDGFRWSNDSKQIAFWQINAKNTKQYVMQNNTDSIYPNAIPIEYPIAGEKPSSFKIGVVNIATQNIKWMNIPNDVILGTYVPRMEWAANSTELIIQHLNRKQNESKLMICNSITGGAKTIYKENDAAWIDIEPLWDNRYANGGWDWINDGKEFIWASEKDGWRHLYKITRDGKTETLITKGNYDVMKINAIDETNGYVYFQASPFNATQNYLYRTKMDGTGSAEKLTPEAHMGTNEYEVAPNASFAIHNFSNYYTKPSKVWVSLPLHKSIDATNPVSDAIAKADKTNSTIEFIKITTAENIEMDAWVQKPLNFDSTKKYPVVFYVYTEPWGQNVVDKYNTANNFLYNGNLSKDGYIYITIDNRGTPVPKGREWRKSVYKKIGRLNISDQAMAAKEILKWKFVDTSRIAVWGWSGGGSATLNLMFQYPEIYKTGIAIAAVGNQLTYDNIYQERYMGLPQENKEDFIAGSPIKYVKGLKGNLLYIHGTGDDNVHYNNAEMLINELIKNKKQFQLMIYPNRTHSISEGEGTFEHLSSLFTNYLKLHCPPGARDNTK